MKLVARAFYDDFTTKGENQPKTGRSDNRGIVVVVLDALTRWVWLFHVLFLSVLANGEERTLLSLWGSE